MGEGSKTGSGSAAGGDDEQREASFVEVVHGSGTVTFLNLDCQLCHFYDQVAQICSIPPDSRVDLATDRGRLQLLQDQAGVKERASTFLKPRTVLVPVLLMPLSLGEGFESETASVKPLSRPSSTRSTSARSRKREEEEDVINTNSGRFRFSPLLDASVISMRFPHFDIHAPGKSSSLKRSTSRRLSRMSIKAKSKPAL